MPDTTPRLDFDRFTAIAPDAVAALRALSRTVTDAGLDKALVELIKVRASQINGCAFCLAMHLDGARGAGVAEAKLDLLATWREADIYSDRERAALAWTEAVTLAPAEDTGDDAYAALREQFDEGEAAFLTVAAATINQWNRIAVALRFPPRLAAPAKGNAA